jgi:hypothetical protein
MHLAGKNVWNLFVVVVLAAAVGAGARLLALRDDEEIEGFAEFENDVFAQSLVHPGDAALHYAILAMCVITGVIAALVAIGSFVPRSPPNL